MSAIAWMRNNKRRLVILDQEGIMGRPFDCISRLVWFPHATILSHPSPHMHFQHPHEAQNVSLTYIVYE